MPLYEYEAVSPRAACARCRAPFEALQRMGDPPLEKCPACGAMVRRVVSLCAVSTRPSTRTLLSDRNLKGKGFTKLVNEGGGRFRKTV